MVPAVDVGDDERPRRALDQVDGVLQLSRVLIRPLFTEFDEGEIITAFRHDRFGRLGAGVLINRVEMLATAKESRCNERTKGKLHRCG